MEDAQGQKIIDAISNNILTTRFEDLDQSIIDNAKMRILDVIGDVIGGVHAPGNAALIKMVKYWGGKKEATILGLGIKTQAPNATMVNCIMGCSFDWEPLVVIIDGKRYTSHTSGTTIPTAITMGECKGINGKELIAALVVGDDFAARLLTATERSGSTQTQGSGRASGSLLTTFAATAIAGRLLGLSRDQMRNAFAIALEQPSGGSGAIWEGATTFKLSQGLSARNGIISAQLARGGWIGIKDSFFGEHGSYFGSQGCDHPETLTKALGKKYYSEVVFKPYPGCRLTHGEIDAALTLVNKNNINTSDIEEVTLYLSPAFKQGHVIRSYNIGEDPTANALFSHRFAVATALVRKSVKHENFMETSVRDPEVQSLIGRVKLKDSAKTTGVELEINMKDGRVLTEYVPITKGEPDNPLSRNDLIAKFMGQVEFSQTVSKKDAGKLVNLVGRLEEVNNIKEIVELAVKH